MKVFVSRFIRVELERSLHYGRDDRRAASSAAIKDGGAITT
jgi:hypothetical protein